MSDILKADYKGEVVIGDISIPCAVLDDGTRVIGEHGIVKNLGSSGGKSQKLREKMEEESGGPIPLFLASKALEPFVGKVFEASDLTPIQYDDSGNIGKGYPADILPKVCDAWLMAREAGTLQSSQLPKAKKAEILMRGLAHIGITALVDEATGYQDKREHDALQRILDKFLKDEARKWSKTFPDDFWIKLIKIKGKPSYMALKRPAYVGGWVNDIVYKRLAPGISKKLKELNPKTEKGYRKSKHHQHLTEDHGVPELKEHLSKVMVLMDAAANDMEFKRLLERSLPKYGDTLELDLV